jgi:alpha-beta hydrolase superfamily lysophospholipase
MRYIAAAVAQALTADQEEKSSQTVPIIFGPEDRRLFGFYHATPVVRSLGVVLCSPIGYELMSAHRTYRHLAERLAARGFPTLRFDYDGTGDSAGQSEDPGRVRAWLASVNAAIVEVRARSGAARVGLFGVRFGATLAMLVAREREEVECVAAWAPVIRGRSYAREMLAFHLNGGYHFSRETLADIAAIDLLSSPPRVGSRMLVLSEGDVATKNETQLASYVKASGADVRLASRTGYRQMMREDPYDSRVPFDTLDLVAEWMERRPSERPKQAPTNGGSSACVLTSVNRGTTLSERPIVFGAGERLFGILAELNGYRSDSRPVLCFLNSGADHHVGPHRLYVELARDLASRGYTTFRFDVGGLGDSRAAPGEPENLLYAMKSVADVQSAMTLLGAQTSAHRFVLIGICAGAYLAYQAAIKDPRVVGQVLINPYAFEMKDGDTIKPVLSNRSYARKLLDLRLWGRGLRGRINIRLLARFLIEGAQWYAGKGFFVLQNRIRRGRTPITEVERQLRAMCDRGLASLLVLGVDDGGREMVARHLGDKAVRLQGHKSFAFEIVEGAEHTFAGASKEKLDNILLAYLMTHFG